MSTRWFVEVSPVDADTLKERYCVEAIQWQQALQQARKLRGDRGPLSRFAIELLEVGYRATDPSSRLRYTVSKAPNDAPLTGGAPANAPQKVALVPPMTAAVAMKPPEPASEPVPRAVARQPAQVAPPAAEAQAVATEPRTRGSVRPPSAIPLPRERATASVAPSAIPRAPPTGSAYSTSPAVPRPSRAPEAAQAAVVAEVVAPPVSPTETPTVPIDLVHAKPQVVEVTAPPPEPVPPPEEEAAPSLPGLELITMRKEEPTDKKPITYREYAFAIAPDLPPRDIERYARATWEQVRTALANRPQGKLVQIALFDHKWTGRPERAPLAVLAWKDWRGDPVLQIRGGAAAPTAVETRAPEPAPAAPEPAAAPAAPIAAPVAAPPPEPVVHVAAAPLEPASAPEPPIQPAAPSFPDPGGAALERPAPGRGRHPTPRPAVGSAPGTRRGPTEDLIGELFEEMHQLHFMPDIVAGAEYVLNALRRMVPCEGVIVHVFDINTRQFVVVRASGPNSRSVLLHRTPDTFPLFRDVFRRARALAFPSAPEDERFSGGRWALLGVGPKVALCGPVHQGGRYLGIIELANPAGGHPFHDGEVNAIDYICEQFADFVASRPIVLDDEAVIPRA